MGYQDYECKNNTKADTDDIILLYCQQPFYRKPFSIFQRSVGGCSYKLQHQYFVYFLDSFTQTYVPTVQIM